MANVRTNLGSKTILDGMLQTLLIERNGVRLCAYKSTHVNSRDMHSFLKMVSELFSTCLGS